MILTAPNVGLYASLAYTFNPVLDRHITMCRGEERIAGLGAICELAAHTERDEANMANTIS